jgi:hypothetical protein
MVRATLSTRSQARAERLSRSIESRSRRIPAGVCLGGLAAGRTVEHGVVEDGERLVAFGLGTTGGDDPLTHLGARLAAAIAEELFALHGLDPHAEVDAVEQRAAELLAIAL